MWGWVGAGRNAEKPEWSHRRLEAVVFGGLFKARLIKTAPNCAEARKGGLSREGASVIWLMSAGRSRPWLLRKDGDDGEGQEDRAGRASDQQAQDAAVHLHGLAALPGVEEGMTGDTPGGTGHRGSAGGTQASSALQRQAPTATAAGTRTQWPRVPGLVPRAL